MWLTVSRNCPVAAFLSCAPHPGLRHPQTVSVRAQHSHQFQLLHRPSFKSPLAHLLPSDCHQHRHHRVDRRSCSFPMGPSVLHVLWPCDVSEGVGASATCIMACIHSILRHICPFLTSICVYTHVCTYQRLSDWKNASFLWQPVGALVACQVPVQVPMFWAACRQSGVNRQNAHLEEIYMWPKDEEKGGCTLCNVFTQVHLMCQVRVIKQQL